MSELLAAQRHTSNNRAEIEASRRCGCCSCLKIFTPDDIVAWDGLDASTFDDPALPSGGTALCPSCGSDSVLGDKSGYSIDAAFLNRMNQAWHQRTIIRRAAPSGG